METSRSVSSDTRALLLYQAHKKSVGVSYLLWILLGFMGAHRFYVGKYTSGALMVLLAIFSVVFAAIGVPLLIFALAMWMIVDLFLIPG